MRARALTQPVDRETAMSDIDGPLIAVGELDRAVTPVAARPGLDAWRIGALLAAALVILPIAAVAWLALSPDKGVWSHLTATVLPRYLGTTLWLLLGVGLATGVIGVAVAWLVTMYRFPGRALIAWAAMLPMAVPAYIAAYVYTDILEYSGPVQELLRDAFGWTGRRDYWFPEIRSLGGAIFVMTLALYPYVYLLARAAFLGQSMAAIEVGRTLGLGPFAAFARVALPLARPAIVIGVSLVMMEALGDFGTVSYFAVATLSAGVYDVWLNMSSTAGAAQLSLVMLAIVVVLITVERLARRGRRYHTTAGKQRPVTGRKLGGWRGYAAAAACALPCLLGFVVPLADLAAAAIGAHSPLTLSTMAAALANTVTLAALTVVVALTIGFFLGYAARLDGGRLVIGASRLATVGYAVPGAVLAVGVFVPLAAFDNAIDGAMRGLFGVSTGLLLSGTLVALVYGYTARFLALSLGAAEAGLAKIRPSMDGAARTLGCTPVAVAARVHLPMLRASLLTGALLVFVDTVKELPLTLLVRPFNLETLATQVYQYAAHERFAEGAAGALLIVLAGIVPAALLAGTIGRGASGS